MMAATTPDALAGTVAKRSGRPGSRGRRAAPLIALGVVALLAGLWTGLVHPGLSFPAGDDDLPEQDGTLRQSASSAPWSLGTRRGP